MSMEKRRDEIGKLLACLLVSRKGVSNIRDLERDYRENEGRNIPFKEFGCLSLLDFLRSLSKHIQLESRSGTYLLYPVVSDKIKHVNDLVSRQRSAKRNTPIRRRPARHSQYFPPVRDPKPVIPHAVQKEIAQILLANPTGVNKNDIVQCLKNSHIIPHPISMNNIDDYLNSMPYTAFARGNMVYPSQSLKETNKTVEPEPENIDGFEIVTPRQSETPKIKPLLGNNYTQDTPSYPAGHEEEEQAYDEDEYDYEYNGEYIQPPRSNMDNDYVANNDYESQQPTTTDNDNPPEISIQELIDRARSKYTNNNVEKSYYENEVDPRVNDYHDKEQERNGETMADCTFESDDDDVDIINKRIKSRLQQLIRQNPDGIWCANLPQAYLEEFKVPLDYADLGFGSVCELASNIPTVFRLHRHNNRGDFMLYDATQPMPPSANKPESEVQNTFWTNEYGDDDVDPFPMALPLMASRSLVPNGVMTHGENVGQERIPELCDMLDVYVVEVYTPSLFWIHLRKKRSHLSKLMESMHKFYEKEGHEYTIPHVILEKGLNCVCIFDGKWHRAIIKTVKPDGDVTLIFYDYGTIKTYPPDALRYLVRTYSNLPAQAIPCGLFNVKPIQADAWTRGVSSKFYEKVADIPLVAMIVKVDTENNSMLVSLTDTRHEQDDHINDWLVMAGLAESGFMGDTVTLECSYLEDQIIQAKDDIQDSDNVPLVTLQSIIPESSGDTLRPPPGLTKPTEPMNYAAFMDECLNGRYGGTDMTNSSFMNFGFNNMNNNPLALFNATYNPLLPLSEIILQLYKQQVELATTAAVNKLLLSNNNSTIPDNLTTMLSAMNTTSPMDKSSTNPFRTYQESNGHKFSTVTSRLEESTNSLFNLNINESTHDNTQNESIFTNCETLPNVSSRESHLPEIGTQKLFANEATEEFETSNDEFTTSKCYKTNQETSFGETQIETRQENLSINDKAIANNQKSVAQQLHDTNPFKQHLIASSNSKIEFQDEPSLKTDFQLNDNITKPPIPPRNPNLVNNSGNISTHSVTDTIGTTSPVFSNQQYAPTTKIYYQAEPVFYNMNSEKSNGTKNTLGHEATQFNDSVSFPDNHHPFDFTNHSLGQNTSFDPRTTNSSQGQTNSGHNSQLFNTTQTNNIFTPSRKFETNPPQCLNARVLSNSYRPPPPPYNDNNSTECMYKKKSPISPRFTSPMMSENSKAAIQEVQSATESNFFKKLEFVVPDTPGPIDFGMTSQNLGAHKEHTSSSLITNNNATFEPTTYCKNTVHQQNFIQQKLLQEIKSTESLKQILPDTLHQPKVLNDTSRIPKTEEMEHIFVKQERSSPVPVTNGNSSIPSLLTGQNTSYNLNDVAKTPGIQESYRNSSEIQIENHTTAQACKSFDKIENDLSTIPTLHNQQNSVNEEYMTQNDHMSSVNHKVDVTVDNNHSKTTNTVPGNITLMNPPHIYQQQPQIPPQFPNIGNLHQVRHYSYHSLHPVVRHPQAGQQIPSYRSRMHGFYPAPAPATPPHWATPQFFHPAFPYMHNNGLPRCSQQPHTWNPYPSQPFKPNHAGSNYRMPIPNSQTTAKADATKESTTLELTDTQRLQQEIKNNSDSIQSKETLEIDVSKLRQNIVNQSCQVPKELTDSASNDTTGLKNCTSPVHKTELEGLNTQTRSDRRSENETKKFYIENTGSTQGLQTPQISPMLPPGNNSGQSSNGVATPKQASIKKEPHIFKPIEVKKQTIYLFNIKNEGWASTDEIAKVFTSFDSRHSIIRILEMAQAQINFMEVSRAQSPFLFTELDGTNIRLPRMINSKKIRGTLHLTPLNSLTKMMYHLKIISLEEIMSMPIEKKFSFGSQMPELLKLIKSYSSDDEYWTS